MERSFTLVFPGETSDTPIVRVPPPAQHPVSPSALAAIQKAMKQKNVEGGCAVNLDTPDLGCDIMPVGGSNTCAALVFEDLERAELLAFTVILSGLERADVAKAIGRIAGFEKLHARYSEASILAAALGGQNNVVTYFLIDEDHPLRRRIVAAASGLADAFFQSLADGTSWN